MIDKAAILSRIKEMAGLGSDADLARFLGVSPATLSNWKARPRGSIDYDLVFSKCEGANLHWLLTGQGEMRISEQPAPPPQQAIDSDREALYIDVIAAKDDQISTLKSYIRILEKDPGREGLRSARSVDIPPASGTNPVR